MRYFNYVSNCKNFQKIYEVLLDFPFYHIMCAMCYEFCRARDMACSIHVKSTMHVHALHYIREPACSCIIYVKVH